MFGKNSKFSKMKKIAVLTPYFDPENFPINNFVYDIGNRGCLVDVITGLPNYRKKGFYKNYSIFGPYKEIKGNVSIYRVPIIPRYNDSSISIFLFYLSFFISSFFFIIFYSFFNIKKIMHVITFCGSPVYIGLVGTLIGLITRSQTSQWIQDIWPEAIETTKGLNSKIAKFIIGYIQMYTWSTSGILFGQSEMLTNYLIQEFPQKKIYTLYNPVRETNHVNNEYKFNVNKNIYVYAGNIGKAQSVETIVKAFNGANLSNSELHLCGDGAELKYLSRKYDKTNIFWHGWLNDIQLRSVIEKAKFFVMNLNIKGRQNYIIPSKLQTYLNNSRPILCLSRGASGHLIETIKGGIVTKDESLNEQIKVFNNSLYCSEDEIINMALNNKNFYNSNFDQKIIVTKFLDIIRL
tara:strand:+ start:1342 stop:2559 length:1218 start_codon:yes stop_codon:yes gene_type:complete